MRAVLLVLGIWHPGCRAVPPSDAAETAETARPQHTARPSTGDPDPVCPDLDPRVQAELRGEAGAEAGKAVALVGGSTPRLVLGAPEAAAGVGAVLLFDAAGGGAQDAAAAAATLRADGLRTFGRAVVDLGDGDGDGIVELAAAGLDPGGQAVVLAASAGLSGPHNLGPEALFHRAEGDGNGLMLAPGWGRGSAPAELLLGLPRGRPEGVLWLLPRDGGPGIAVTGEGREDYAGSAARALGDLDGDGLPDLAVGAWGADVAGTMSGSLYLVSGPVRADLSLADASARIDGADTWDLLGWAVEAGGDLNGDGLDDLIVGAPGADGIGLSSGAIYGLVGPWTGVSSARAAWSTLFGPTGDLRLGWSLAPLAQGAPGVAVGGPGAGGGAGALWMVRDLQPGVFDLGAPDLAGPEGGAMGGSLSAGDLDHDGCLDLLVGGSTASTAWLLGGTGG